MFQAIVDVMTKIFEMFHSVIINLGVTDKGASYVLAVCLLTLVVKLLILPFNIKGAKSNARMQEIQPELNKLKKKYANNPEMMNMEMSRIMKENNVSMLGGCLPMLLPMPILFALYGVFRGIEGIKGVSFLWIPDLAEKDPIFILPVLAFIFTYVPSLLLSKATPAQEDNPMGNMKTMNLFMAGMMAFMSINFSSLLVIYWVIGGVIQLVQTYFVNYLPAMKKLEEKKNEEAFKKSEGAKKATPKTKRK